jgi:hypothetical protein
MVLTFNAFHPNLVQLSQRSFASIGPNDTALERMAHRPVLVARRVDDKYIIPINNAYYKYAKFCIDLMTYESVCGLSA